MPTAPDHPIHPVLDEPTPRQPAHYAEQALLGGLLLEPHRLKEVSDLAPEHCASPAHSALLEAIHTLPAPDPVQHTKDPQWLNAVLAAASPHARGLSAAYLHTLVRSCPRPQHVAAYANAVLAEHARRTLREHAQRLAHTATDTTHPDPVTATLAQADALAAHVETLATRYAASSAALPRTATPPSRKPPADEEALDEERLLLATATARPSQAAEMCWLTAGDFTHPLHAALWQSLTALLRRGDPIDPVTLLCEAQQHGVLSFSATAQDVLALLATPVGAPQHWGERIVQRSLLAQAHQAARRIEAYTLDAATTPPQLCLSSRRALADLTATRTRWARATQPPPAATGHAREPSAPRTGPPVCTTAPTAHPLRTTARSLRQEPRL
ncbi:DnaB-like helicase N-terminal domain-containing protein [Streptomyces albus]|uniref:DnaB-like helicase N-terminal domain-containing protein n=1 Tax=Streptomyces albus TaxID=1888 RepID=UPI0033E58985